MLQPRPVECLIFVISLLRNRTLLENFAFEPSTAIAFNSLKSTSWRNFERSERSKVWKLGAFKNCRFLILSNLRQRFWSVRRFDSSEISKIWKQSLSNVRTQSFQKVFDVERSAISTSNAQRFRRRTLRDVDVECCEISSWSWRHASSWADGC